jgi:hypothetical protein
MTDSASGGSEFVGRAMPDRAVVVVAGSYPSLDKDKKDFPANSKTGRYPPAPLVPVPYLRTL